MPKARASFKLFRGMNPHDPIGVATFFGKSQKKAEAAGKRYLRNVAAGFYDDSGVFHPIRASYDYSEKRAGERAKPKARKKSRKHNRRRVYVGKRTRRHARPRRRR